MKISRKEFGHDYASYRFGYCEYLTLEEGDIVADVYDKGFLPYSADPAIQGVFYMARSARIVLTEFARTSENRRVGRFFDDQFSVSSLSKDDARADKPIRNLFLTYFEKRHGPHVMPPERFDAILASPLPLHVLCYKKDGELVAVVLEVTDGAMDHFWFSAYDLSYVNRSFGMWLLIDAAERAKEVGIKHYYLGTVYGSKALYKTNLEPLEFWSGSGWENDLGVLKTLATKESRE